jgi:iron complex outermembrane recepter protein
MRNEAFRRSRRQAATRLLTRVAASALAVGAIGIAAVPAYAQEASVRFDIPAGPLADALLQISRQGQVDVTAPAALTRGRTAPAVSGTMSPADALSRVLAGSGLTSRRVENGRFVVATSSEGPGSGEAEAGGAAADSESADEQIIVTGTNIAGQAPVAAQRITIDRSEIERSGAVNVEQLFRQIPQNFGGVVRSDDIAPSEGVASDVIARQSNQFNGAALNLRGYGSGATLVLINGRRSAPSGRAGNFTDISSIPLSAIERIEILPDGASAIYGADAVGGVVNIILRRQFSGLESAVRYGYVDGTGARSWGVSQAIGTGWSSGRALLNVDYSEQSGAGLGASARVTADLREFGGIDNRSLFCDPGTLIVGGVRYALPALATGLPVASSLVARTENRCNALRLSPRQTVLALAGSAEQRLAPDLTMNLDLRFARRESSSLGVNSAIIQVPRTSIFYVNPTGGTTNVAINRDLSAIAGPSSIANRVDSPTGTLALAWRPSERIEIRSDLVVSREESRSTRSQVDNSLLSRLITANPSTFNPFAGPTGQATAILAQIQANPQITEINTQSDFWSASLVGSGELIRLAGRWVSFALGAEYREQDYATLTTVSSSSLATPTLLPSGGARETASAFGEIAVPLLAERGERGNVTLSGAGRLERTNDFGTAFTPQLGAEWTAFDGVRLRGQWRRSFKAPDLERLNLPNTALIQTLPDPSVPGGSSAVLIWSGGNPALVAETSETWTAGIDVTPRLLRASPPASITSTPTSSTRSAMSPARSSSR